MVLLSVGQHLSLWPAIETHSPYRGKLQSELHQFSDVNHLFFAQSFSDNAMSEFKVNFE